MNNKLIFRKYLILLILTTTLFSCKRNPLKVDISGIENEIKIVRFEKELFSLPPNDTMAGLSLTRDKYTDFFDLFTWKVINAGGIGEPHFPMIMKQFLTDTMIINIREKAENEFSDFDKTADQLIKAFKYYQYHFPDKNLPVIYTMISGFNQSVVTAEDIIGVSLDKYLGRDFYYYQLLSNVPLYKIKNMHPKKLVPDVAYAWGMTEFDESANTTSLLDHIIYQGKLMYVVDAMLPVLHDSLKIGYTASQLEWCKNNESEMWNHLVENKLLFSTKRMEILRFINDGPSTTGFPVESPARTGIWIGWQIVRQYMKKNKELTLPQLMENKNYQQILNDSGYFPE